MPPQRFEEIVEEVHEGLRLDVYLAACIEDASRSYLKRLIKEKRVSVNGAVCARPSQTVHEGYTVAAELPPPPSTALEPQDIPLEILHEDADVLVINKPSGLVVHPAPGHADGTLVNAVLHHCKDFLRPGEDPQRPGIVHRLDQYTSGVMVVAKSPRAFASLAKQAHDHEFDRRYIALVQGQFKEDRGRINATVGRSTQDRKRMTVTGVRGKDAVTNFTALERFGIASLVSLELETGRTHQIRVHLRFAGHPVLGDPIYGVTDFKKWPIPPDLRLALESLNGQALHAEHLGFEHPGTRVRMHFTAPPPADFEAALAALRSI